MGMQEDIRRLMDLEAIRDLARRYAHCVWIKDPAGAAALIAVYRNAFGQSDFQPFVHNHVIELADDRATGVCYLDLRAAIDGRSMIGAGYYHDVYIRRPDGWKFKSRQLTLAYLVPLAEGWVGR